MGPGWVPSVSIMVGSIRCLVRHACGTCAPTSQVDPLPGVVEKLALLQAAWRRPRSLWCQTP